MKSEPEIKKYISDLEDINKSIHKEVMVLEPSDVMSVMLSDRMSMNYARMRTLEWVLKG